jgi:hypothetical protein
MPCRTMLSRLGFSKTSGARVAVYIDESRRDDQTCYVKPLLCFVGAKIADRCNAISNDTHVGATPWVPGAIDNPATRKDNVKRLGRKDTDHEKKSNQSHGCKQTNARSYRQPGPRA